MVVFKNKWKRIQTTIKNFHVGFFFQKQHFQLRPTKYDQYKHFK